jgi:hypothetical protein
MWRIDDTGGTPAVASIGNVPPRIFTATGSGAGQQGYDLTIVADPAVAGQLIIGGAALEVVANDWNAALWLVQVQAGGPSGWQLSFTPPAPPPAPPAPQPPVQTYNGTQDPTYIGAGVHADVHCAAWTTSQAVGARHVWVGCDATSTVRRQRRLRTFLARNTGVGSLQPTGLRQPASLHDIVIDTQDNGMIRRASDTVWRAAFLGDGGGTAFFASATAQYRQYVRASWKGDLVIRGPSCCAPPTCPRTRCRRTASSFYSVPRPGRRESPASRSATRVWCHQDGGTTFFTLPGGLDPSGRAQPADTADSCVLAGGAVARSGSHAALGRPAGSSILCQRAVLVRPWAAPPPCRRRPPCDGSTAPALAARRTA